MSEDDDSDESVLERAARRAKEKRPVKTQLNTVATLELDIKYDTGPWLQESTIETIYMCLEFLSTAATVDTCINRMRLLADRFSEEADKLSAKGIENFHQSFNLH